MRPMRIACFTVICWLASTIRAMSGPIASRTARTRATIVVRIAGTDAGLHGAEAAFDEARACVLQCVDRGCAEPQPAAGIARHRGAAGADQVRDVQPGRLAAQVPQRVVDARRGR